MLQLSAYRPILSFQLSAYNTIIKDNVINTGEMEAGTRVHVAAYIRAASDEPVSRTCLSQ